ncbi:MAG TPA: transposase [Terriglobales bacterium]|nr:transposase [Terriglobales bacterium]
MPIHPKRFYGHGDLYFITFSCYRRLPLLGTGRRRDLFLRVLEKVRCEYRFTVVGYVLMPEHVHLFVSEPEHRNLSVVIKALKQAVAHRALSALRRERALARQLALFSETPAVFWQARFYDFNVFTEKKRTEKLRYMHRNPVKRGLVSSPERWRWSSFRSYALRDGRTGDCQCDLPTGMGEEPGGLAPAPRQAELVWGTPSSTMSAVCLGHPPLPRPADSAQRGSSSAP